MARVSFKREGYIRQSVRSMTAIRYRNHLGHNSSFIRFEKEEGILQCMRSTPVISCRRRRGSSFVRMYILCGFKNPKQFEVHSL